MQLEKDIAVDEEVTEVSELCAVGDIVKGSIVAKDRSTIYIDLPPIGTGIIYGREFIEAKDILRKAHIGDSISAKVIELETPEGYIDLSLKEARQGFVWKEAEESMHSKRAYEVIIKNANRGGLVIKWNGIRGFLPASQLSEKNYPKVLNGDKESILTELKKFINQRMNVVIESVHQEENNLIFSEAVTKQEEEKASEAEKEILASYKIGDVRSGIVTGIVDFGVFVTIDNNVEGLVHISEMDWGLVDNPRKFYSIGDTVKVKIIRLEDGKYSFSIKAVMKNPWDDVMERYEIGKTYSGVVLKYNTHGTFVAIEPGIAGLVHISNFESENEMREKLEIGRSYEFVVNNIEPEAQKIGLKTKETHKKSQSATKQPVSN